MTSYTNTLSDLYQDYNEITYNLQNDDVKADIIYENIMQKEESRINLLNRIIDQKDIDKNHIDDFFFNMSISNIIKKTIMTWWEIYIDIVNRSVTDPLKLFWKEDRKIYTGILLLIIAIVLFFVNISE